LSRFFQACQWQVFFLPICQKTIALCHKNSKGVSDLLTAPGFSRTEEPVLYDGRLFMAFKRLF
jgi:hypothetical protein